MRFTRACVKEIRDRLGRVQHPRCNKRRVGAGRVGGARVGQTKTGRTVRSRRAKELDAFNSQELLKFLGAFERLGGGCQTRRRRARAENACRYRFPAMNADVELSSKTPTSYRGTGKSRVDDSCGGSGRGNTGVTLWEGSFVLAGGCRGEPGASEDVVDATDGAWAGAAWKGRWASSWARGSACRASSRRSRGGDGGDGRCGETRRETPRESPQSPRRTSRPAKPPNPSRRRLESPFVNPSTGPHRVPGVSKRADL